MVSRYYRPPEICLGLKYSFAMDLWSVGVCLFELYTGKFMFTGRNNNEMLKQFMVSPLSHAPAHHGTGQSWGG
jgi:serine/threonine-protein kinase PRP4